MRTRNPTPSKKWSAEKRAKFMEACVSRIELSQFGDASYCKRIGFRGLISQMREAGYIPADMTVDEEKREFYDWIDAEGRQCSLRPYSALQWELRRTVLPHERDEAKRQREEEKARENEEQAKRAARLWKEEEANELEKKANCIPVDVQCFKKAVQRGLNLVELFKDSVSGKLHSGCALDEESVEEIDDLLDQVRAVVERARYIVDPKPKRELLARAGALRAGMNDQLQGFLKQVGAK